MSWFTTPFGLLGLLAVPAVVALHLFRRRHQDHAVSSLFLWEDTETAETAGPRRQPLRRTPSFWLEVMAALLAGLWLGGMDPLGSSKAVHMVVILDDTASMAAKDKPGASLEEKTPHGRALKKLDSLFSKHGRRLRTTLVKSGQRPSVLAGPGALTPDAKQALEAWQPVSPSHSLGPALTLARELAAGGEILVFTDQELSPAADDLRVISVGQAIDNFALAEVRRSRTSNETSDMVQVAVRGYSDQPGSTSVKFVAAEKTILERKIQALKDGERSLIEFEVPARLGAIEISLVADALEIDNHAVLHPLPDRRVKVLFALDGKAHRELGLAGAEATFGGMRRVSSAADADLIVAHQAASPPAWNLVMPKEEDELEAFAGPFAFERRHPLMSGLTLEGVIWTRSGTFGAPGSPLISAGDRTLLSEQKQAGSTNWFLNLLPGRSTLQRSPDWPIFFTNLLELRRSRLEGPQSVNLVAGEAFVYRADESAHWTLTGNGKEKYFRAQGDLRLESLAPFGFWKLRRDGNFVTSFAVNFVDPVESDLRNRGSLVQSPGPGRAALAESRYAESSFGKILLLLLLMMIAADWWVLGRRAA